MHGPDKFTRFDKHEVAPGVRRENSTWGYILNGNRDALIASGLVQPEWFADWTERNKKGQVVRSKKLIHDGRKIRTVAPANGPCLVYIDFTEEERKKVERDWEAHWEAQRARQEETQKLRYREERAKEKAKMTREEYRRMLGSSLVFLLYLAENEDYPWRFGQADYEQLLALKASISALTQSAPLMRRGGPELRLIK